MALYVARPSFFIVFTNLLVSQSWKIRARQAREGSVRHAPCNTLRCARADFGRRDEPAGSGVNTSKTEGRFVMIYYALVFLIVGLVAGALGLFGIAAIAGQISWVLFLVGIVLLVIHLASGRHVSIR